MAKRTKAEIAAEIERLQTEHDAADDAPDDVLEVWVEHDGRKTKMIGPQAERWLRRNGLWSDDEPEGDGDGQGDGDDGDDGQGDDADPPPPKRGLGSRYFGATPTAAPPAKKTAPPAAGRK